MTPEEQKPYSGFIKMVVTLIESIEVQEMTEHIYGSKKLSWQTVPDVLNIVNSYLKYT